MNINILRWVLSGFLIFGTISNVNAGLIKGEINDLAESSNFDWGDGLNNLFQQWSANTSYPEGSGKNYGWFYSSEYGNSNADVYVYSGLDNVSTVSDASTFSYTDVSAIRAAEGDTVFFRGTNDYYGAWVIDDIYANPESDELPYTFLSGQWYFQDDGSGNFTETTTPETSLLISDFSGENPLENWDTEGNGTVKVITSPAENSDNVMQMTVDDISAVDEPISSSFMIEIPNDPFFINFDYLFQTPTGSLEVWLNDTLLTSFFAVDDYDIDAVDLLTASIQVDDPDLLDIGEGLLKFSLYPGSPAGILIGGIALNTTGVAEPSTLAIFALGLTVLASRRFKKKSNK